ncbi:MAG: hypothetical protein QW428_06220 [Conexivisphaerales archaeon]
MIFIRGYNIYEDKENTEGDKAMSHMRRFNGDNCRTLRATRGSTSRTCRAQ